MHSEIFAETTLDKDARIVDADPDARCDKMDLVVGKNQAPHYLYYDASGIHDIPGEAVASLRKQFFGNDPSDRFDLELHRWHGHVVLRVRGAKKRRLTAVIRGQVCQLIGFYDLKTESTHVCFR